jgi:organic radical activating enzyme
MFTSVQTEGARCGTLTHFLRLGGCNFNCPFCDTPLDKFEMLSPAEIASHLCDLEWKRSTGGWVVITGGEPMVHNLWPLLAQIGNRFSIAMESNGSLLHQVSEKQPEVLRWIDWLTISPKTFMRLSTKPK